MGYFSNRAIDPAPQVQDHSVTEPHVQLLWRLEDLKDRLQELLQQKGGDRDEGVSSPEASLRYVLPAHFSSASEVRKAIELAISDLWERYGIVVSDASKQDEPILDEITDMQITFYDLLHLRSLCAA